MGTDYAKVHRSKRERLLDHLSDLEWHPHYELARVAGVRYSARLLELRRLGYTIVDKPEGDGKSYRLAGLKKGAPQEKRVKVFLTEDQAQSIVDGSPSDEAKSQVMGAIDSFSSNRENL